MENIPDRKTQAVTTIKKWLEAKSDTLAILLGSTESAKRFGQVLLLACLRQPSLLTCDLKSLFMAALYCAQRGLEPGVQDGCALVPYKGQVVPVPQYRALVKQAIETGSVRSAKAILIHANDHVEWEEGMHPKFVHRPAPLGSDRGPVVGAYSRIVMPDGSVEIEVMTLDQIYKRRDASASWRDPYTRGSSPWALWEEEMIKKTVIKNGLRTIPVAPKLRDLLETDSSLEGGAALTEIFPIENEAEPPTSKAEEIAQILTQPEEPEPVVTEVEAPQMEPEPEAAALEEPAPPPPPEEKPHPTDQQLKINKLYNLAVEKNLVGMVLKHFKLDKWDDLLAFPEMVTYVEKFLHESRTRRR